MQQKLTNSFEWAQKYSTLETCLEELNRCRWKNGFTCLKYGHQVSPNASTVFEHTRLQLRKWLATIYLIGGDNVGISAQRFSKMIGVSRLGTTQMLKNLYQSMGSRDRGDRLEWFVEVDYAFVGGRKLGKKDREAVVKKLLILSVEQLEKGFRGFNSSSEISRDFCLEPFTEYRIDTIRNIYWRVFVLLQLPILGT